MDIYPLGFLNNSRRGTSSYRDNISSRIILYLTSIDLQDFHCLQALFYDAHTLLTGFLHLYCFWYFSLSSTRVITHGL